MKKTHDRMTEYKPNAVPSAITRTLYIGYGIGKWNAGRIVVDDHPGSSDTDFAVVPLLEKEISVKLPPCKVDVKGRMLEVLEEEKQKVMAENHARLKDIQERIDQLKVLEFKPTA